MARNVLLGLFLELIGIFAMVLNAMYAGKKDFAAHSILNQLVFYLVYFIHNHLISRIY